MSSKCDYCSKQVYHAEKQTYNNQTFHAACLTKFKKENPAFRAQLGKYVGDEDRVVGPNLGQGQAVSPRGPAVGGASGGAAAFCPSCGTPAAGGAFCSSCGGKLQ
eukprot:TRINITY_DN3112_c0_g1_i1.p1 TRINITY_DN3112_c0_g1~~TRINITY_DN3112_c0_g1_i1.p1  ORF type:complete len:105 (+),score=34.33 TRINITY_DN3112_c0_g1_i1:137-451(+)